MIKISIRNNFPEVARELDRVGQDIGNKAMARALNATIAQGKTAMARQISQEFRIKVGTVKERLVVRKATVKGTFQMEAILEATRRGQGRSMNLIHFVTKLPITNKKGAVSQLQFQIKRAGGRKMIKGAFIGNKERTVFIREGKGRIPIKALNTIDVPQMFNTKRINSVVRVVMLKRFDVNFRRELRAVLKGFAR